MPAKKLPVKRVRKSKSSKGGIGGFSVVFFGLGVLVVIFVVAGFFLLSKPAMPVVLSNTEIKNLTSNSSVIIPEMSQSATITNGMGEFSSEGAMGSVTLSEPYFSTKTPDGFDLYTVMTVNYGGSGEFVYIALFSDLNNTITYKGAYPLEDRIKVTEIKGPVQSDSGTYSLEVDYLGRPDNAPMSETPTVLKTVELHVKDSMFTN